MKQHIIALALVSSVPIFSMQQNDIKKKYLFARAMQEEMKVDAIFKRFVEEGLKTRKLIKMCWSKDDSPCFQIQGSTPEAQKEFTNLAEQANIAKKQREIIGFTYCNKRPRPLKYDLGLGIIFPPAIPFLLYEEIFSSYFSEKDRQLPLPSWVNEEIDHGKMHELAKDRNLRKLYNCEEEFKKYLEDQKYQPILDKKRRVELEKNLLSIDSSKIDLTNKEELLKIKALADEYSKFVTSIPDLVEVNRSSFTLTLKGICDYFSGTPSSKEYEANSIKKHERAAKIISQREAILKKTFKAISSINYAIYEIDHLKNIPLRSMRELELQKELDDAEQALKVVDKINEETLEIANEQIAKQEAANQNLQMKIKHLEQQKEILESEVSVLQTDNRGQQLTLSLLQKRYEQDVRKEAPNLKLTIKEDHFKK